MTCHILSVFTFSLAQFIKQLNPVIAIQQLQITFPHLRFLSLVILIRQKHYTLYCETVNHKLFCSSSIKMHPNSFTPYCYKSWAPFTPQSVQAEI